MQHKKRGNRLALKNKLILATQIDEDGSSVNLILKNNRIEITMVEPEGYKLTDLIGHINESNLHNEISPGEVLGKEI